MNVVNIAAEVRNEFGKQASHNFRKEGKVPCVLYGGEEVKHFLIEKTDLKPFVYTPEFNVIEVKAESGTFKAIVKDVQFHPVTEEVEHIDFQELVEGKLVKVSVPVKLIGDSLGVKEGGSLVTVIRKLPIKATPENLVTELIGDISHLNLSQAITVREMLIPDGIQVMQDPGSPVGYIEVPRSLKSLESSALLEEGEEGEEGGEEEGTEKAAEEGGSTEES